MILKKTTLILFLLAISTYVNAQEGWFKQKIDEKVTVNFPVEPRKISDINYGIKKDDIIFLVTYIDIIKGSQLTLDSFKEQVKTQKFADEFLAGLAPNFAKYTFEKTKVTSFQDYPSYVIQGRDETNKMTIQVHIVFIENMAYSLTTIFPDGKSTKEKDTFLDNIHITK